MGDSSSGGAPASPFHSRRRPCETCRGANTAAAKKSAPPTSSAAKGQRKDDAGSARETSIFFADSAARTCSSESRSSEAPRGGSRDSSTLESSSEGPPKSRARSRGSRARIAARWSGERSEKNTTAAAERSESAIATPRASQAPFTAASIAPERSLFFNDATTTERP